MSRASPIFLTLLISLMAGISNGNVLGLFEDRVVTNAYDRTYRLVTETAAETGGSTVTTTYDHDKANNRTEKIVAGGSNPGTWTFAHGTTADGYNSNQVKSVTKGATVTTFVYDLNGNRTEKKVGGTTVQTYGFDRENRLTSLTDSAKGSFAYSYDHRTRRVGRDETGASGTEDEVSFAGGLSVQEYIGGSGTPTVEYVRGSDYGGGIGGVLYTIRGGSARSYNAYNSRGDVVSKTDQAGAITWQSSYEAFGTRTQEQGSTDDRQKANTKDEDPTGLLNEGMRYRDLEFGIFLTRDPAGFVDGPNVYTYVRQNPWTSFDPLGLWETGSYWGDVGQVWVGYGRAIKGTAVGLYTVARHPVQTAKGIKAAASDPVGTFNAIKKDYDDKLQTNAGTGEIIGEVLIGVATGGSLKSLDKAGDVADVAKVANKLDNRPDVGGPTQRQLAEASGKCFPAGTLVLTPDGQEKIEEIDEGQLVLAFDEETGELVERNVTMVVRSWTLYWVEIDFGVETVIATRGHRFWVESEKAWIEALNLKPGMTLREDDGELRVIVGTSLRKVAEPEATYNFEVAEEHNYFVSASRILVHSGDNDDKPHTVYKRDDDYKGLTNDFERREGEWAREGRRIQPLHEDIPDREAARGVEQYEIERNREKGVEPDQRKSIDPKRTDERAERMRKKGKDYLRNKGVKC